MSSASLRSVSVPGKRWLRAGLVAGIAMLAVLCLPGKPVAAQTAYVGKLVGGGFADPVGVAVDGSGNVYVADVGDYLVKEVPAGCVSSSCVIILGGSSTFTAPFGVAVDGSGNVYVAQLGNAVYKMANSCRSSACVTSLGGDFIYPAGVGVDSSGNVYVADVGHYAVKMMSNTCTSTLYNSGGCTVTSLGGGSITAPTLLAVDGSGNVYVSDFNNSGNGDESVKVMSNTCTSSACVSTLGNYYGLMGPYGVAVDGSGNVYVANSGNHGSGTTVSEFHAGCTSSSCEVSLLGTGFNDPGGAAVDSSGNVYIADGGGVVEEYVPNGMSFPSTPVGSSTSSTVTFTITSAGAIGVPAVLTQGSSGRDFTDAGTGTCTTTNGSANPYSAYTTCTVNVIFAPKAAGTRYGAVELLNTSGTVIATAYLYGTGTGPQVIYNAPLTPVTLAAGGFSQPHDVAVDASGNVYVADTGQNETKVIPAGCNSTSCLTSPIVGAFQPAGVAVDGSGKVYAADTGSDDVEVAPVTCGSTSCWNILGKAATITYNPSTFTLTVTPGSFNAPNGVAVDTSGNVYVADTADNEVKVVSNTCTSTLYAESGSSAPVCTVSTLGGGFKSPSKVAVDASGNVYVADAGNNAIKEMANTCTSSSCVSMLGSGFSNPGGVAVDGGGNVYVADTGNNAIKEMPAGCSSSCTVTTLGSGFSGPKGVAVAGNGNVYVADTGNNAVKELVRNTPPTITFNTATLDSTTDATDGTKTVSVQNDGNQPLVFAIPTTGTNPTTAPDFTFTTTGSSTCPSLTTSAFTTSSLAANATCTVPLTFTPVEPASGALTESVVFTDNALNASAATQSITLKGTAIPTDAASSVNSTVVVSPSPAAAGATVTVTVTLEDAGGNAIPSATASFSSASATASFGTPSVSGNVITVSMTDTAVETASISVTLGGVATGTLNGSEQFVAPAYVVTVATDESSGSGVAANCVDPNISSAGNTNCSLRDAVAAANALAGVTANISFSLPSPSTILIAQLGGITISQSVNINGPGANSLTVEGGTTPLSSSNNQILTVSGGNVSISSLTLANAHTTINGGAINAYGSAGTLTVSNSTFSGDQVSGGSGNLMGGAIAGGTGNVTVTNSTFSGNSAAGIGGAIYAKTLTVADSTFSGNQAGAGGGAIDASGTVAVTNSIFTNDSAAFGSGVDAVSGGTVTHIVYNGDSFIGVTPANSISANPKLSALGIHGGPTPTLLPLPGSPAICAGVSTGAATDQRGVTISGARYGQSSCYDIGAVQTEYALAFTTSPANTVFGQTLSPTPVATVIEDGTALTAGSASVVVTPAAGTLSGTATESSSTVTATAGQASFPGLSISPAEANDTLTATLALTSSVNLTATSNSFQVLQTADPVSAANSTVAVSPSPAAAGSRVKVTVTLNDAGGNPITGATASFSSTSATVSFGTPSVSGNVITVTMTDTAAETAPISILLGRAASGTLTGSEQFLPALVFIAGSGSVASLNYAGTVVTTGTAGGGIGAAVDQNGLVFSITADGTGISTFNPDGTLANTSSGVLSGASALAIDGSDQLWIAFPGGLSTAQILGSGTGSVTDSTLQKPGGVAIDISGNVWVTDSQSSTVHEIIGGAAPAEPLANAVQSATPGTEP